MIDHSTWWSPRGNAGEQVSPREGHTPWCLFTSLLGAAMGGADYAQLEVDWAAYDKAWNLLPWGRAMKTLYAVTRQIGARGNTVTRFAILIGHENGWPVSGGGWATSARPACSMASATSSCRPATPISRSKSSTCSIRDSSVAHGIPNIRDFLRKAPWDIRRRARQSGA